MEHFSHRVRSEDMITIKRQVLETKTSYYLNQ